MIERDWLCLELLKTRGWESRDRNDDVLDSPVRYVAWARKHGLLARAEARLLREAAGGGAVWIDDLVTRTRELRGLLYRMFTRVAEGVPPDRADLESLEGILAATHQRLTLVGNREGIRWEWNERDGPPLTDVTAGRIDPLARARILGSIARSATDLLTSGELDRVKVCDAHDCGWFFVDVSRNRSRRWCDMAGCGNRDKARRYRERQGAS